MLSAIIAAVAVRKNIRKSRLANEVNARCLGWGGRRTLVSEFNCLSLALTSPDCSGIAVESAARFAASVRGDGDFMRGFLLALAWLAMSPAVADEGMWTFDNFPSGTVQREYGAEVDAAWLDHVRASTIRLTNCTASFVSPEGLILTNHHCVEACLAALSSKDKSLVQLGFAAPDRRSEPKCPAQLADVLVSSENVTDIVSKAIANLSDTAANESRKRTLTTLEQSCEQASARSKSGRLRCQVVTLYQGGQYFLYKYKRYVDVRLVFAPEADIASFGGDPDNFQFPRWSLDFSFLRAYEDDKPARTPDFLPIDFKGPGVNQLVFVSGHPGSTARLQTRAQLEFDRDLPIPITLMRASELRGRFIQFGTTNPADERIVQAPLNSLQNAIKVRRKELDALNDDALLAAKSAAEDRLRTSARLGGSDPWQDIESATVRERSLYLDYTFLESAAGFNSGQSPAGVHRCLAARDSTRTVGQRSGVSRARGIDALLFARAHARMAGPRSSGRAPALVEGVARLPCRPADRGDQARRRGGAQAPVGGRQAGGRCIARSDARIRARRRRRCARRAQAVR
jgi:hypothetical protein